MGLISGVLTLPLAPVRGLAWVAGQLQDEAERQLYDAESIRAEMLQLELDSEEGRVDERERAAREEALFERLVIADVRRRSQVTQAETEHGNG
jgi:hypothetical protein